MCSGLGKDGLGLTIVGRTLQTSLLMTVTVSEFEFDFQTSLNLLF